MTKLDRIADRVAERLQPVTSTPQRWCPHEPHPKQRTFLDVDALEALYGGAAGGGKSDALLMAALQHVHVPGYSAMLFRRTYTDLALPGAIMARSHEWLNGTPARWHDRDKVWTFPSGASLAFGYMDGPRDHLRYQGAEFQFVGFDELTQFEQRQYRYLFSRLRRREGVDVPLRMRGATNPGDIGHEWVKERFITDPQDRVFVAARLEDNPSLDQAEYETSLARLDAVTRRQLRHGEWVRDTSTMVYKLSLERSRADRLPVLLEEEGEWSYVLGADYGHTDATAFVELAFCAHRPELYVTRAESWKGLTPSKAGEKLRDWDTERGGYDKIVGDMGGLGKGYAEEAKQRFAMPVEAAEKANKLGYIKLLNGDLEEARVKFLPGTEGLTREMLALAWEDERQLREHPGLDNHLCDALLYGWREGRHWQWEPRTLQSNSNVARALAHKARLQARIRRANNPELDEWILGPE